MGWSSYMSGGCPSTCGGCGTCGGSSNTCGGVDELKNDVEQVFSRQKETMIRKIAQTLNGELGIKVDANADVDTIVKELSNKLPNPRPKNGKATTINASSDKLSFVCKKLAKIINENYGSEVIDMNSSDDFICNKSMEVIHSLLSGLHTEFLSVAKDVKRIVKNILTLRTWLDENWKVVQNTMANETDERVKLKFEKIKNIHGILENELSRQLILLQNLMQFTLQPVDDDIIDVLKSNKDFKNVVDEIKKENGPEEFTEKVALVLRGFSNVSDTAKSVAKALKATGMTLEEYSKTNTVEGLKDKIYNLMKGLKKPAGTQLQKFAELSEIIYKNNYLHDDIVKYLSENRTTLGLNEGSDNEGNNEGSDNEEMSSTSGYGEHPSYKGRMHHVKGYAEGGATGEKLKLDKRIKKQKQTRELLNKGFVYRIGKFNDNIYRAVDNISHKVGVSIPLSDELSNFVKAFERIEVLERNGIQYALTGQDKSTAALNAKSQVIGYLNEVARRASLLEKGSGGEYFTDIRRNIESINDTIKTYSDTLNMGNTVTGDILGEKSDRLGFTGKAEEGPETTSELLNDESYVNYASGISGQNELLAGFDGLSNFELTGDAYPLQEVSEVGFGNDYAGASEGEALGGSGASGGSTLINPNFKLAKNTGNITKSATMMKYYFKIAKIRENLRISATELKEYSEEYEDLLGEAIGKKIDDISNQLDKDIDTTSATIKPIVDAITGLAAPNTGTPDAYKEWLKLEAATKIKFIKTVEVVDLYLSYVTNGLANNPDDLKDMADVLDSVKIISKWFNEKSGDDLAKLFDSFLPAKAAGAAATPGTLNNNEFISDIWLPGTAGAHYFDKINSVGVAALGNHQTGIPFQNDRIKKVLDRARDAVSGVQTLKNIVSAFTTIGNKFGGADLAKKLTMTPATIYNNLVEFLYVTCLGRGVGSAGVGVKNRPGYLSLRKVCNDDAGVMQNTPSADVATNPTNPNAGVKAFNKPTTTTFKPYRFLAKVGNSITVVSETNNSWNTDQNYNGGDVNEYDILFTDVVKAMAAKVLATVKTYSLFRRPSDDRQKIYRNPVRMILGGSDGGDDTAPSVHAEAFELYVRLPLLAEFYKNVFEIDDVVDAGYVNEKIITIVPEFENVWSGLIKVIFDSARYVQEGAYSRTHVIDIVKCVNDVYSIVKTKNNKNTTQAAVLEFIAEINRRYGILMKTVRDEYKKEKTNKRNRSTNPDSLGDIYSDDTNYEILMDEGEPAYNKPAASDKYVNTNLANLTNTNRNNSVLDMQDRDIVLNFRARIDYLFAQVRPGQQAPGTGQMHDVNFDASLKDALRDFNKATSQEDKFTIVMKTIQSSNQISILSKDKYVLFHETVVAGLTLLDSLKNHVVDYIDNIVARVTPLGGAIISQNNGLLTIPPGTNEFSDVTTATTQFNQMINDTFRFGYSELVSTKVDRSGYLLIDTTNLTSLIDNQISIIRYCLDKYRSSIDKSAINSFDNLLNEYEEEFVEKVLKDATEHGIGRLHQYVSTFSKVLVGNPARLTIDKVYNDLIFTDKTATPGAFGMTKLMFMVSNFFDQTGTGLTMTPRTGGTTGNFNYDNQLINRFNSILSHYLNMYFDGATNKIYQNLIEPIVSGHLANAIESSLANFTGDAVIDDDNGTNNKTPLAVLYGSLAFTMKKMMTLRDKNDVARIRVVSTLSEVSSNVREKMRVYLPIFVKEFDTMAAKATYIKQWIDAGCTRDGPVVASPGITLTNNNVSQVLDNLIQACRSVRSTAVNVYRELDDQPQYMETYHNSLTDYKAANNKDAFTPLSNLLHILNTPAKANIVKTTYDATDYKYLYGVRGALVGPNTTLDKLSNVKNILTNGNEISDTFGKIEEDKFADFTNNQITLLRYLNDSRAFKYAPNTVGPTAATTITPVVAPDITPTSRILLYPVSTDNTYDLVALSENNNIENSVIKLIYNLQDLIMGPASTSTAPGRSVGPGSRVDLQVMNILDMNVMPINVHALMREVPLVNLYNYSYTFDKLIADMYNGNEIPRLWENLTSTENAFAQLLVNPYKIINGKTEFYQYIGTSMIGLTNMELGRPRYLSDQLWNKVLVQTMHRNQTNYEGGPGSALISVYNNHSFGFEGNANFDRYVGPRSDRALTPAITTLTGTEANMVRGRFDTIIVRNLYFTSNVQRMLMKIMRDEFTLIDEPVVSGHTLLDARMTEYGKNSVYDKQGPFQK